MARLHAPIIITEIFITIQVVLFLGPNSVFKLRGTFNVSLLFQGKENSESAYKAAIIPNDPASTN